MRNEKEKKVKHPLSSSDTGNLHAPPFPGTLTIFLGAASGVGKTYAMLETAKEKIAERKEVVIAFLETHGRSETENIAQGIPVIEPLLIEKNGTYIKELNLDEVLGNKPDIAVVDDMAHSNHPKLRNKKRYQDLEELLKHGIDVYTTLNIQNIESLFHICADITELSIQETVPDNFLQNARIQLVDLDPETLIQRLLDDKVFIPGLSKEEMHHFYRPGNINALREIALRYTAKQVDKELSTYMENHSIEGPWSTSEKVLLYIETSTNPIHLLRTAKNLSDSLQGELVVAIQQTPTYFNSEKSKTILAQTIQLAEEFGAEIILLSTDKLLDSIIQIVKKKNISQVLMGKHKNKFRWMNVFKEPFENVLLGNLNNVRVHLLPLQKETKKRSLEKFKFINTIHVIPLLYHILLVVILTIICKIYLEKLGMINISTLFIIPLLLSSLWGYQNSIIVTLVSFLLYDFFFITPQNTFIISDPRYLISLIIFLFIAFLAGYISLLYQKKADLVEASHIQINSLFSLSKDIALDISIDSIITKIVFEISEFTDSKVAVLLPNSSNKLQIKSSNDEKLSKEIHNKEMETARWTFNNKQMSGKGTQTHHESSLFFYPILSSNAIFGVIALSNSWLDFKKDPLMKRFLEAISHLTAIALHRHQLTEKANEVKLIDESQRLQKALFDSISHDLNTPLTSIIGASSSLLDEGELYSKEDRKELMQSILQDANDMNRLVRNLLDMALLDNRVLQLKKEFVDIADIVDYCIRKMKHSDKRKIVRMIDDALPSIPLDTSLIQQVVSNLLDNAFKYSPENSKITINAYKAHRKLYFSIEDEGIGIPSKDMDLVFTKFYRSGNAKSQRGSGLGLSICKGIIEAHKGEIWVKRNRLKGSEIVFFIPYERKTS